MTQKILLLILSVMISLAASAQVGINTITPDPSAALDVTATDKGLLIPRVALASAIPSPAAGLMVHQTTAPAGFYYYNGTAWTMIGGGSPSELEKITEAGKTGHRILGRNPLNYGDIGIDAIDLSLSPGQSPTKGATGDYSTSLGYNTTASGFNSTAMGSTTVAFGQSSTAMGIGTTASGQNSTAMGNSTTASGLSSTAMGNNTSALADYSTAMGNGTTASGQNSTAMGINTIASGQYSTAMGVAIYAKSLGETVVGIQNTEYTPLGITEYNASDRAFGVGIGPNSANKKDGLIVYKDGTLAFNKLTVAPTTTTDRFYVLNNKLNYNGTEVGGSELQKLTEGGQTGWRLLGRDPAYHGNIGSGAIDLTYSDEFSETTGATGVYSTAMGINTTASGAYSTAMGVNTNASGSTSIAMGDGATASGFSSMAMGSAIASGAYSTAMGIGVESKSYGELAVGTNNTQYTPTGITTYSANDRAFGVGIGGGGGSSSADGLIVYKSGNTYMGNVGSTPASGTTSIINGYGAGALQVRASGDGFNLVTGTGSNSVNIAKFSTPSAGNRYISFGHLGGTYLGNFTEIGRIEASGGSGVSYMTSSDARLKINNGSFSHGLSTIKSINIHNYTWKEDQRKDVGVFAQELYKVFPIAVSKGDDNASLDKNQKIWQVDYSKLVPVLIAATQELSKKIEELEAKNANLTSQVKEMASLKSDMEAIKTQLGLSTKSTVSSN